MGGAEEGVMERRLVPSRRREDWRQVRLTVVAGLALLIVTNMGQYFWNSACDVAKDRNWHEWFDAARRGDFSHNFLDSVPSAVK